MIMLFLFIALLVAGIAYLFWFLTASDGITARRPVQTPEKDAPGPL